MPRFIKPGNQFIFMLFRIFNIVLFLISIGFVGISIFLFVLLKASNALNVGFLVIGIVLAGLSLASFKLRKSLSGLNVYLFFLTLIAIFDIIFTVLMFVDLNSILDEVAQQLEKSESQTADEIKKNLYEQAYPA